MIAAAKADGTVDAEERQKILGCAECGQKGELTDRMGVTFAVECHHYRSVALLNSVPLDIAERNMRGLDFQVLYFTRESSQEIEAVTARFIAAEKTQAPHTTGLYYRTLL
jgi:hypothetical protein